MSYPVFLVHSIFEHSQSTGPRGHQRATARHPLARHPLPRPGTVGPSVGKTMKQVTILWSSVFFSYLWFTNVYYISVHVIVPLFVSDGVWLPIRLTGTHSHVAGNLLVAAERSHRVWGMISQVISQTVGDVKHWIFILLEQKMEFSNILPS